MPSRFNLIVALSIALVLLGTAALYWSGLDGPFLFDDYLNIVEAYVDDFNYVDILYAVTHNTSGDLGRPVSVLSLLFSGIVHGPVPWGYKFHNLAIHLINSLLVFWLLLKLLPKMTAGNRQQETIVISGIVATLWLLHPIMVSTVLYAVQRMAQLSALFILAALLSYVFAREFLGEKSSRFYFLAYGLFPIFLILGILSKENAALIPFFVLITEGIAFRFSYTSIAQRNRLFSFLGIFAVLPILAGSLYVLIHFNQLSDYSLRDFTLSERLMSELHVVVMYLKMILLPRLSDMTLFHDYVEVTRQFDVMTGILLLLFLAAVYMVYYLRERAPVAAFAIAWFIVSHLMESTVFSLELMFEHRNYLAAVGPLLALVYYLFQVREYPQLRYLTGVALLLFVLLTMGRVQEWRSKDLILEVAITEHPDSYRAQTEMANFYYSSGEITKALEHLSAAQQINRKDFGVILHEVIFRCGTNVDMSPLLDEALGRAAEYPVSVYSLNALDNLLVILNMDLCPEFDSEALLSILLAAKQQQDNRSNELYLGFLERIEGQLYLLKGDYIQAISLLLSAYDHTGMVRILANLAENLIQLKQLADAEHVINLVAEANAQSFGTETALLNDLQDKLNLARSVENTANMQTRDMEGDSE